MLKQERIQGPANEGHVSPMVSVPIFEKSATDEIVPNPLFHRPWDLLHSRCIEYPYAAANMGDCSRLLDVGTSSADQVWVRWLESLPIHVSAVDADIPAHEFRKVNFSRCDVRELPFPPNHFDTIFAVSVLEHIGLENALLVRGKTPPVSADGDMQAIRSLCRVLKPGGRLVLTVPYGVGEEIILGGVARSYNSESIRRFYELLEPVRIEYYEYQCRSKAKIFQEEPKPTRAARFADRIMRRLASLGPSKDPVETAPSPEPVTPPSHFGLVTWRKIPIEKAAALNVGHVDGVLCSIWTRK